MDNPELLILMLPPPKCWAKVLFNHVYFIHMEDPNQGFVHGRQEPELYLSNRAQLFCSSLELVREPRDPTPGSDLHPE